MEKIYRVQMNSNGMPNFSTAVEVADRPQGEWIYTNDPLRLDDEWVCSRCGNVSFARTNFCDRCGARMKGADDETD